MEEATANTKTTAHADVLGIITSKIIEHLEKGTVPWRKPWADGGMPQNIVSKQYYRGINMLLLAAEQYEHNLFLSFKQVGDIGAKVKKGMKGHIVVYWNKKENKPEASTEDAQVSEQKAKAILRYYYVFNVAQCENIPEKYLPQERETTELPTCEAIVNNMTNCPPIRHKENAAFYNFKEDFVNMPKKRSFKNDEAYYSTLFHELVHSTGHASRLNRDTIVQMAEFGSELYSIEELVAEIGTCYLQSYAGIQDQFLASTAYIQGWLSKLKNDRRLIFTAAKVAQKAVDYILDVKSEAEEATSQEQ